VRAALRRLARGYFVSVNRASGECSLHPLDREYAYRQLPEGGSAEAYTRRALELRAADFYAGIRKPESAWKTIDDLAPQLAEFEHRVRAGDYDGACRVLELIDLYHLHLWGHYDRLVRMREKLLGRLKDPILLASNLGSLGNAYRSLGQLERSVKLYEQALDIARRIGDHQNEVVWLGLLGFSCRSLGQIEQAIKFYEQALDIARLIGDHRYEGTWLGNLGLAYHQLGQFEQANRLYGEALVVNREIGDRLNEGHWLGFLGRTCRCLGQIDRAIGLYEEALTIARQLGDRRKEGIWLSNLGLAYYDLEQFKQANELYEESLTIDCEMGNRLGKSYNLLRLGKTLLAMGKLPQSHQHCTEALALGVPETGYEATLILGIILLHQRALSADDIFMNAAAHCRTLLDKTPGLYEPRYALGAALVGQAVCDPRWADASARAELLAPALEEYHRALAITAAPGVVQDALRDLELIRAAGVEGLEPAFELLKAALPEESQ
jgi:tetratricopeptide (TPR) repeat protein